MLDTSSFCFVRFHSPVKEVELWYYFVYFIVVIGISSVISVLVECVRVCEL